jgi:hypothetical protein
MQQLIFLLKNFFTHKDFLPPADQLPGTIYTPLHWVVSMLLLAIVIGLAVWLGKRCEERTIRRILLIIWIYAIVFEPTKILWETFCGKEVSLEVGGVLPFYPCSVFMLALPLLVFGGRRLRLCGGGYLCTIGMLGAMINFFYPINVLSNYSCISFAGAHTLLYHGAMLFCCLLIQISGYHRYSYARNVGECFFAALPLLIWSIPANIINYSPIGSDYMFFKCNSFFLPAIFGGIPDTHAHNNGVRTRFHRGLGYKLFRQKRKISRPREIIKKQGLRPAFLRIHSVCLHIIVNRFTVLLLFLLNMVQYISHTRIGELENAGIVKRRCVLFRG